jgi:uncharacterized protein YkwD
MRRPIRCRRAAITIAGASLALVPFVGPASALTTTAHCTSRVVSAPALAGRARTSTAILTGCTPVSATGGWGIAVTNLVTHVSKTTWAKHRGTTIERVGATATAGPSRCPDGTRLFVITGRIIGGSGAAMTVLSVGMTISARVCVRPHAPAVVEPGAQYRFAAGTRHRTSTTTTEPPTTTTTARHGTAPPAVPLPSGLAACPANAGTAMITLVNRDRHQTGNLAPLTENTNLDWAARKHSVMMASTDVMTHNGWDTEIHDSHYVVGAPGWTGQNIAYMSGGFSPATIESMFFNEVPPNDGHRLNILSTNYHNIGIGCIVNNSTHTYWWSQDFGS